MALTRTCPSCNGVAPTTAEFCPSCLGEMPAVAIPPGNVAVPDDSEESRDATPPPLAVTPASGFCAVHRDKPAVGTCPRCGAFFCFECVPDAAERDDAECPTCLARQPGRSSLEQERLLFRDLGAGMALYAAIEFFLGAVLPALEVIEPKSPGSAAVWLVSGFVFCSPLLVAAAVTWLARSRVAGWLGLTWELLLFLGDWLFAGTLGLDSPVLFVILVVGVLQLLRASRLRAQRVSEPEAVPADQPIRTA